MAEYNTLRAEVLAARSYLAQAIGVTFAVIMGVAGFSVSKSFAGPKSALYFITGIALMYLAGTFVWNEINTRKFTKRLRELEADINERAGERLLVWETDAGWGSIFTPRNHNGE